MTYPGHVDALLAAIAGNRPRRAARLLAETPAIAETDVFAAAAAGDAAAVGRFLASDPGLARARDRRRDLTPLIYAAATRLGDPAAAASLLLDAGADPNEDGEGLTPLHAAVRADAPALVELLLGRGADPDDGDSLYHATELDDHACLRLLLAGGATEAGSSALAHMLDCDDPEGTRLLLEAGAVAADPNLLRHAIWRECGAEVVGLLLGHGADAAAPGRIPPWTDPVGSGWPPADVSTLRLAVRKGRPEVAALLRAAEAPDDVTPADRAAICDAAHYGRDAGVALMLELGFPFDATGDYSGTPLHLAAMRGRAGLVALLLDRGADPNLRDRCHGATALQWALMGHPRWGRPERRWPEVVEILLARGTSTAGCWLPDDGPIADVLAAAGVE
jgi:ankyrin repeat protein